MYQRRDAIQALAKSMVSLGTKLNNPSLDQNMMCTIFWPVVKDDAVKFPFWKKCKWLDESQILLLCKRLDDSHQTQKT